MSHPLNELYPELQRLQDTWNQLRAGRSAPRRREIEPRRFQWLLDRIFLLDWTQPGVARFRLAGTMLCDAYGMELRSLNILSLWAGESRRKLALAIDGTVTVPEVTLVEGTLENEARDLTDFQMLLLPLREDGDAPTRILGAIVLSPDRDGFEDHAAWRDLWVDTVSYVPIAREASNLRRLPPPCRAVPAAALPQPQLPLDRTHAARRPVLRVMGGMERPCAPAAPVSSNVPATG